MKITLPSSGISLTIKGFPYTFYTGENIEDIAIFCSPYEVTKTKKFNTNQKITIHLPAGNTSIESDNILVKINSIHFLVLTEEAFHELFFL